jgi:hypothetical protein
MPKENNKGKNSIFFQLIDGLCVFLFFMFYLHLCVYLGAYLCCEIFEKAYEITQNLSKELIIDFTNTKMWV